MAGDPSFTRAATPIGCSSTTLRTCAQRFLADGRTGLADRQRMGRPRRLDATTWTVADLTDLLRRRHYPASPATVYRPLHRLDNRYRRSPHDLSQLQKTGLLPGLDSAWSVWMNVTSIPIPTWSANQRRAVFGAVDYGSGQVLWHLQARKGGDAFAAFLARIT